MVAKSKKLVPVPVAATLESIGHEISGAAFSPDSLAHLGRANLDALAKANLAWSAGWQAIGDELFAYAKTTLANASRAATDLLGAKTLDEVMELNNQLAKTAMASLFARSNRLGELGLDAANQALAPLGGRFEATMGMLRPTAE